MFLKYFAFLALIEKSHTCLEILSVPKFQSGFRAGTDQQNGCASAAEILTFLKITFLSLLFGIGLTASASAQDCTPFTSPSNLRLESGDGQLTAHWDAASCAPLGYRVRWRVKGKGTSLNAGETVDGSSFKISGLKNGTAYVVRIDTIRAADNSLVRGTNVAETGAPEASSTVIGGELAGTVTEDASQTMAKGTAALSGAPDGANFNFQRARKGTYGTFSITDGGVWTYTLDNDDLDTNALGAGDSETDRFTIAASDGAEAAVIITVNGADDKSTIGGALTGSVNEDDTAAGTANGTATVSDVDTEPPPGFNAQTRVSGKYGTFSITTDGAWTYTLDNDDPATNALGAGDSETDKFTITTTDGTEATVIITVNGADDTPGEDTVQGNRIAHLKVSPRDQALHVTWTAAAGAQNGYRVRWREKGQGTSLNTGATVTGASYEISGLTNGTTYLVRVDTINAANNGLIKGTNVAETGTPEASSTVIDGNLAGTVTEDASQTMAKGTATLTGPPGGATFNAQREAGTYGTFSITDGGVWTYTLDNEDPDTNALGARDRKTDRFPIAASDGAEATVVITVNGADDKSTISGALTGSVNEDDVAAGTANGTASVTDVDTEPPPGFNAQTRAPGKYGTFSITDGGVWTYTLDNEDSDTNALGAGDSETDKFTIRTTDGTEATVIITVNGADDTPGEDTVQGDRIANLKVSPRDQALHVSWTAAADAQNGFLVRWREKKQGASLSAGVKVTGSSIEIPGLKNGTTYLVRVDTVNAENNGLIKGTNVTETGTPGASSKVQDCNPLTSPSNLRLESGDGQLTAHWDAASCAPNGYLLSWRRADSGSTNAEGKSEAGATDTSFTITGLTNGQAYYVAIGTIKSNGEVISETQRGDETRRFILIDATGTPEASTTKMGEDLKVSNLQVSPRDKALHVSWTAAADAQNGYRVRWRVQGQGTSLNAGTQVRGSSTEISDLKNGTTYIVRVDTINAADNGLIKGTNVSETGTPAAQAEQGNAGSTGSDIGGELTGRVIEDLDNMDRGTATSSSDSPFVPQSDEIGEYGVFTIKANGEWTYKLDNHRQATQALNAGDEEMDTFEIMTVNGSKANVTIHVEGTDEIAAPIGDYLLGRASALVNNQPDLIRFLKDPNPRATAERRFNLQATEHSVVFDGAFTHNGMWGEITGARSERDSADSNYLFGSVGVHMPFSETLLGGVMLQFDRADENLNTGQASINGQGWLIGPYFVARSRTQPLFFEGRLLYGGSRNEFSLASGDSRGGRKGSFDTERMLAKIRAEGEIPLDDAGFTLSPYVDAGWFEDRAEAFTDDQGIQVRGQTVRLGQLELGSDFAVPVSARQGNLLITGGMGVIMSHTDGGSGDSALSEARGRVEFGVDYRVSETARLTLDSFYDGIGVSDFKSYGLSFSAEFQF